MKPYYYISRVSTGRVAVKYRSLESAQAKSIRLAGQHPGEAFEILLCLGITQTTTPQTFWMDGVEPEELGL